MPIGIRRRRERMNIEFSNNIPKTLNIEKSDRISVLYAGGSNFAVDVIDSKHVDGEVTPVNKRFMIKFEDEETLDYFMEKTKKEFNKKKPSARKRLDSVRLKAMEISRELELIKIKQKQC